jgi:hypothetical protein
MKLSLDAICAGERAAYPDIRIGLNHSLRQPERKKNRYAADIETFSLHGIDKVRSQARRPFSFV